MDKKTVIFIFALALIAGAFWGLKFFLLNKNQVPELKVVYISPEDKTSEIVLDQIFRIDFNRPLADENEIVLIFEPIVNGQAALENKQQTLIFNHQEPLHANANYTLMIKNQKGQVLAQTTFATIQMQSDPYIPYQIEEANRKYFPLLEWIPYNTENFSVYYVEPLTLEISIQQGEQKTIEPKVIEWIRSHGIDPATHQIQYK
ncbi:MAG: hypothetical protein ABH807_02000 [Candidatus Shapirobacteria bacterium]